METITRAEYEEFKKRNDDENHRQNKRIEILEESVHQIVGLATSVEKLAANMENMVKEQEKQGKRLEILEGRDGVKWRQMVDKVIAAIVGAIVCYIFTQIGM